VLIEGSPVYHHRFTFYDPEARVEFSDIIEIHTLELRKLPDGDDGTELYDWAKFIDAAPNNAPRQAVWMKKNNMAWRKIKVSKIISA